MYENRWEDKREAKKIRIPAWAWVVMTVALVLAVCISATIIAAISDPKPVSQGQVTGSAGPSVPVRKSLPPTYRLGVPIRGGDFTFTIHSKKCGISEVGSVYLEKKPQGSYCRLDMTVKNVTGKPHIFLADGSLTVTDTRGRTFGVDGEAGAYGNKDPLAFMQEINPGNAVRAFVFFDVSGGVKLVSVTFEAGLFTLAQDVVVPLA